MERLKGKVAVITGAGSGIGRQTAIVFAREGAKVFIGDYNGAGAAETVKTIREAGGEADFVVADVSKAADVENMINKAVARYNKIDILYNNAGTEGKTASIQDTTESDWDRTLAINLKGVFLGMKYAIPIMIKNGGGSIINTASIAGLVGFENACAYCASKAGIIMLTKEAAVENFKNKIRVNCICPGFINTPMIDRSVSGSSEAKAAFASMQPRGHFGEPLDIANAALFLASDESVFVNGHALVVDDGYVAR